MWSSGESGLSFTLLLQEYNRTLLRWGLDHGAVATCSGGLPTAQSHPGYPEVPANEEIGRLLKEHDDTQTLPGKTEWV